MDLWGKVRKDLVSTKVRKSLRDFHFQNKSFSVSALSGSSRCQTTFDMLQVSRPDLGTRYILFESTPHGGFSLEAASTLNQTLISLRQEGISDAQKHISHEDRTRCRQQHRSTMVEETT